MSRDLQDALFDLALAADEAADLVEPRYGLDMRLSEFREVSS